MQYFGEVVHKTQLFSYFLYREAIISWIISIFVFSMNKKTQFCL